jgi:hypothetical protein
MEIGACGTIRPHAAGADFPILMKQLKQYASHVPYNTICAIPVGNVLCFAWQDNNIVLGLSTIHTVNKDSDLIERMRRRPKKTSTNAAIVRPIFGDETRKNINIPRFIDDYNHYMGGVDIANQHRAAYETHLRTWRSWWPLWTWAIDVSIVNCFKIQSILFQIEQLAPPDHYRFREELYKGLFGAHKEQITARQKRKVFEAFPPCRLNNHYPHVPGRIVGGFSACRWCRHSVSKRPKQATGKYHRASPTQWKCVTCCVPLCLAETGRRCWEAFHSAAEEDLMQIIS